MSFSSHSQQNFQIVNDNLIKLGNDTAFGHFMPYVQRHRYMQQNEDTLKTFLGYQRKIKTTKAVLVTLFLVCGLGSFAGAVYMFKKIKGE